MARRSDHSRTELYDLALQAARGIVETEGLRGLTARSVADRIGYSPGTLYNLFTNLDEMIVQLNGRTLDELFDHLAPDRFTGDPEADLERLLDRYLDYLAAHPDLRTTLFDYTSREGRALPDWYTLKVSKLLGLIETALSPLFAADEEDDKRNAARILWASLHGICSLSDAGKLKVVTTQPVREMAETLVALFLSGLAARKRSAQP